MFLRLFIGDDCLGRACYEKCKYKPDKSSADIRVGDFWGGEFKHDVEGVNSILVFSEAGQRLVEQSNVVLKTESAESAVEGQIECPPSIKLRDGEVFKKLQDETSTIYDVWALAKRHRSRRKMLHLLAHPVEFMKYIHYQIKIRWIGK